MEPKALIELAKQIEAEPEYDADLCRTAFDQVEVHLPEIDKEMIRKGALGTVDAVLLIVDHGLPGWTISMHGTASERHGDWTTSLRRSDTQDNDAVIGIGKGPKLSNTLVAALLKALAHRPPEAAF
ncbi:hypothetical protein JSE7799_02064 [Jannaschia seosinensis]|uniref:Uncharacterized protein n=1 Tax=Jannaschia seosinensis TaxID=313367 RepID=A0A0M7B9D9_9RHOB|nr:hypothetical protein [Jannaschia seosinensis]CUH39340.1 hypothetical protein JSE7799_02064 [Jannaschia seosinensis]